MNQQKPTPRRFRLPALTPVALGVCALVAVASAGVAIAQSGGLHGAARAGATVRHAAMHPGVAGMPAPGATRISAAASHANTVMMLPASDGSWAGPITPDEKQQIPRKLSPEERTQLRQEIRSAGEEVYEPYRHRKQP